MSDKFFFKGRQDARQNHVKHGYKTKADHKPGSKKYPLSLVVTSDERKDEVEALVVEAGLYAEIVVAGEDGAVENIAELNALLNRTDTVKSEKLPGRNDPCSCGSGKKYKKCCS